MIQETYRGGCETEISRNFPVFHDSNGDLSVNSILKKILSSEFDYKSLMKYPYESPEAEESTGEEEDIRQRFVHTLVALENLKDGLGKKIWCSSRNLHRVTKLNASHRALEIVYQGPEKQEDESGLTLAHLGLRYPLNAKGVRNRLRIVEQEAGQNIRDFFHSDENGKFKLLSVAAGSARGMIKAMANSGLAGHIDLFMVDKSKSAERDGKLLATNLGVEKSVEFKEQDALQTEEYLSDTSQFHMIEVVGLLDYYEREQCVTLLTALRENLAEEGKLLFSNIAPNGEIDFLERVVGWEPMKYRNAEELLSMAISVGFDENSIRLIREPLGMYNIITAVK